MSTVPITCGYCEKAVAAELVAGNSTISSVAWLRCPSCYEGSVKSTRGRVYPSTPSAASVDHLPDDVATAWEEARISHGAGAYTASEIMCRKILMHLAVDVANAPSGKNFTEYIDCLDSARYIVPGWKPVVDAIRKRGNVANHDLPASTDREALTTLKLTEQLLRIVYETPRLVDGP